MGITQLLLLEMNAVLHQNKSVFLSALAVPSERQVVHAGQRVGMVGPELRLARLHHLHV